MKPAVKSVLIWFYLIGCINAVAQEPTKTTVAVVDYNAPDLSPSAIITLTNTVRKEFLKNNSFNVVDRNNMEAILKEQGFQQSGACMDLACMVQVGQLLRVQKMVGGTIGKLGNKFIVDLQIIDVQSSRIEKMESEQYVGPLEELDSAIRTVTLKLLGTGRPAGNSTFLYITSQPEGAKVILDGSFKGNAPLSVKANADKEYTVRVEMDGYPEWRQMVQAKAEQTTIVNAVLTKSSVGVLPYANQHQMAEYEKRKKSPAAAFIMSFLLPPAGHFYVGKTGNILRGLVYTAGLTLFALNVESEVKTPVQTGTWPNITTHMETSKETNSTYTNAFVIMWVACAVDAMVSAKIVNNDLKKKYGVSLKMDANGNSRTVQLCLNYRL